MSLMQINSKSATKYFINVAVSTLIANRDNFKSDGTTPIVQSPSCQTAKLYKAKPSAIQLQQVNHSA